MRMAFMFAFGLALPGCGATAPTRPVMAVDWPASPPANPVLVGAPCSRGSSETQLIAVLDKRNVLLRHGAVYEVVDVPAGLVRARLPLRSEYHATPNKVTVRGVRLLFEGCLDADASPEKRTDCLWDPQYGGVQFVAPAPRGYVHALMVSGEFVTVPYGQSPAQWRKGKDEQELLGPRDRTVDLSGLTLEGEGARVVVSETGKPRIAVVAKREIRVHELPGLGLTGRLEAGGDLTRCDVALRGKVAQVKCGATVSFFDLRGEKTCEVRRDPDGGRFGDPRTTRWSADGRSFGYGRAEGEGKPQRLELRAVDVSSCESRLASHAEADSMEELHWAPELDAVGWLERVDGRHQLELRGPGERAGATVTLPSCDYVLRQDGLSRVLMATGFDAPSDAGPVSLGGRSLETMGKTDFPPLDQLCGGKLRFRKQDGTLAEPPSIFDRDKHDHKGELVVVRRDEEVLLPDATSLSMRQLHDSPGGAYAYQATTGSRGRAGIWRCSNGERAVSCDGAMSIAFTRDDAYAVIVYGERDEWEGDDWEWEPEEVEEKDAWQSGARVTVIDMATESERVVGHVEREQRLARMGDDFVLVPGLGLLEPASATWRWKSGVANARVSPSGERAVLLSDDCRRAVVRDASNLVVAELETGLPGERFWNLLQPRCHSEWLADERYLSIVDAYGRRAVFHVNDWQRIGVTEPGTDWLGEVASGDAVVGVLQAGAALQFWDLSRGTRRIHHPGPGGGVTVAPDGRMSGSDEAFAALARTRGVGPLLTAPLEPVPPEHPQRVEADLLADVLTPRPPDR